MDREQLFRDAKERVLEDGKHAPTLFAENRDGAVALFHFADLPDSTQKRQYALFGLGRKHAATCHDNPLAHLYFISEAWVSYISKGERRKYSAPSEDPKRKEVIMIIHLDVATGKSEMHKAEMLRSADGALVDLLVLPHEEGGEVHDRMLPCFLAGFLSAEWTGGGTGLR